jgi:hypothetical protein
VTHISEFKTVTDSLGIFPDELGVVMLDFEAINNPGMPNEWFYYSSDAETWWTKGWVGGMAHLTLKYGFLKPASELKNEIGALVKGLTLPTVDVAEATSFQTPGAPYSAVVLKLAEDEKLLEFHRRLSYLPHIDTFTPWVPHVTLAYVHADKASQAVALASKTMVGRRLIPRGLNLGEEKY